MEGNRTDRISGSVADQAIHDQPAVKAATAKTHVRAWRACRIRLFGGPATLVKLAPAGRVCGFASHAYARFALIGTEVHLLDKFF